MTHMYNGLTALQVAKNRSYFGANTLSHAPWEYHPTEGSSHTLSLWFVRGVLVVIVVMLFVIPLVDLFTGNIPYEIWIAFLACVLMLLAVAGCVLLIAAIRRLVQCHKDKRLKRINEVRDNALVRVVREGETRLIPRKDIVVGDVILLGIGDEVPADAVLLESTDLVVSEYFVNGKYECMKTTKHVESDSSELSDSNYVICGSMVLQGEAVAQVFAVGNRANNEYINF